MELGDEMENKEIDKMIAERKQTHYGYLHDVGMVLDKIPTLDLSSYYIHLCGSDKPLRYFLEQQISDSIQLQGRKEGERLHRP